MTRNADVLLFVVFPYVAVVVAVIGAVYRFAARRYSYSSLSSQFLEGRRLFWGSAPFHYGLLLVLTGHLIGVLIPRGVVWFNSVPARLYILEITGLALGLLAGVGLLALIVRRFRMPRVRVVTTVMDVVLLAVLLLQILTGVYVAVVHRWGSAWFVETATPYLWSLARLSPEPELVSVLPLAVKLHVLNAWLLVAILPFTRLVHLLVVPLPYLWRPYQLVMWYRRSGSTGGVALPTSRTA